MITPDPLPGSSAAKAALANAISAAIIEHYGWQPLGVRYGAADAAIAYLHDHSPGPVLSLNEIRAQLAAAPEQEAVRRHEVLYWVRYAESPVAMLPGRLHSAVRWCSAVGLIDRDHSMPDAPYRLTAIGVAMFMDWPAAADPLELAAKAADGMVPSARMNGQEER